MRKYMLAERRRAVLKGLDYLYRTALDPRVFEAHGSDLLNCFRLIASTSGDRDLRRRAGEMGPSARRSQAA